MAIMSIASKTTPALGGKLPGPETFLLLLPLTVG